MRRVYNIFGVFFLVIFGLGIVFFNALAPIHRDRIFAAVVPHHDLVKAQRAELFDELAQQIDPPKTIILVSPNHYDAGVADVQTTKQSWNLNNGNLEPDTWVIGNIPARIEPANFQDEHGIFLVLPDIKRVWPDARIVPIILKMNTTTEEVQNLERALYASCKDCLLIASVDFSHYQPTILAEEHDRLSIRALENLDTDLVLDRAEVDSPASLELLMRWAQHHNTERFVVKNHTNSGTLTHAIKSETTSHVLGWYAEGDRIIPEKRVSFLFGGDMMFGRQVYAKYQGNLQETVAHLGDRVFWGTDAGVINLEGAISALPVRPDPSPTFKFVFPRETADILKFLHINGASLANNHANNNGVQSEDVSREILATKGIWGFGGWGSEYVTQTATFHGEGLKLVVIGVHVLVQKPDITDQIRDLKRDSDVRVIVMPHWGTEYEPLHDAEQEAFAHAWIDAGADMIIGSHPHVVQDIETYRGKLIIYSLGNLVFDQDWSVPTQHGLLVGGAFTEHGLEYFTLPTVLKNYQPQLDMSRVSDIIKP